MRVTGCWEKLPDSVQLDAGPSEVMVQSEVLVVMETTFEGANQQLELSEEGMAAVCPMHAANVPAKQDVHTEAEQLEANPPPGAANASVERPVGDADLADVSWLLDPIKARMQTFTKSVELAQDPLITAFYKDFSA